MIDSKDETIAVKNYNIMVLNNDITYSSDSKDEARKELEYGDMEALLSQRKNSNL